MTVGYRLFFLPHVHSHTKRLFSPPQPSSKEPQWLDFLVFKEQLPFLFVRHALSVRVCIRLPFYATKLPNLNSQGDANVCASGIVSEAGGLN